MQEYNVVKEGSQEDAVALLSLGAYICHHTRAFLCFMKMFYIV